MKFISLSFILSCTCGVAMAQSPEEVVAKTFDQNQSIQHLKYMASDELAGRNTPSEGQDKAADYIVEQFKAYGIKALEELPNYRQEVPFIKKSVATKGTIMAGEKTFKMADDFLIMAGNGLDWKGELVFVKVLNEEVLAEMDLKDKVVLTYCGDGVSVSPQAWFDMIGGKRKLAREAGAVGVIELYNSPSLPWNFLVNYFNQEQVLLGEKDEDIIPTLWMKESQRETLEALQEAKKIAIDIPEVAIETFNAANLVGYVPGTDPELKDEYVIYTAHYDHVGIGKPGAEGDTIYNGARDNAVGVTGVLAAAENMAKYPAKRSTIFVMFTAEEKGLLGSAWFADHPPVAMNQVVFNMNIDNGGYNDTEKVTVIGLSRTTAKPHFVNAAGIYGLEAIDDPVPEQNLFDRSDNVQFAKKGVPAPDFSMGLVAFDQEIMKYYHQAGDEVESLDLDYVTKYWQAYLLAGRLISNAPEAPFWVEGDKYYPIGVQLYRR